MAGEVADITIAQRTTRPLPVEVVVLRPAIPPKPRKKSRRGFRAIAATQHEISLPMFERSGFLKQSREIQAAQAGDLAARNAVWVRNARLAYSVANRVGGSSDFLSDLIQAGQFGVCRAIKKFDVSRLNDLSTYAWIWVRQFMQRERDRMAYSAPVPAQLTTAYQQFRHHVAGATNRAEWFEAREVMLDRNAGVYFGVARFHAIAAPDPIPRRCSLRASDIEPQVGMESAELRSILAEVIEELEPRLRGVIASRYGLKGEAESTLDEIGQRIGVTKERVRQLQLIAEDAIRQKLYDRGLFDTNPREAGEKCQATGAHAVSLAPVVSPPGLAAFVSQQPDAP